ncbi:EAL and HDOD domain-containing protein [Anaerobranca gottschalkii]|uniref:EAL and modified HD-GYP domain-containing signal transduction protein n=1 Tax=Anaerobranca gottschalkii DSM 13577 TaxID=1120990 RepID=A0A1I0B1D1_9FIRM|nr:HDOD domain-containing protein [Anaerobranca gottschalkii]SET00488.1 EAL and modified HD-GYP domain-containing signal transduction protein [Anaerobranca gottschalkii DSM 13577]
MEVFIARQPIFDRNLSVYGYELLYRNSMDNYYQGNDDNQATAELINNAFFTMDFQKLTDGKKAFINFSQTMLEREIPLLLPKDSTVVEVLENVKLTEEVIKVCEKLKKNGYTIAIDDFVFHQDLQLLLKFIDIVKVEFNKVDYYTQSRAIKKYGHQVFFLAEKIETREDFIKALNLGYQLFQGYFFSKPTILKSNDLVFLNVKLLQMLEELSKVEPNFDKLAEIIQRDLGLTYRLLKLVNSVYFSTRQEIKSVKHALVRMGIVEIKKWIFLMLLIGVKSKENNELVKNCLIRGKMMELLAKEQKLPNPLNYFLTGMFSAIDILLNKRMQDVLDELPLDSEVKQALLGNNNRLKEYLDLVISYEKFIWEKIENSPVLQEIGKDKILKNYIVAIEWAMLLEVV